MANKSNEIKVVFVGDGGVGKTTYLNQMLSRNFEKKYIPTIGADVHPIDKRYNGTKYKFNVWDCAGQENLGGFKEGYFIGSNNFVVFYDGTSQISKKHAMEKWTRDIKRVNEDANILYVCTKSDLPRKVRTSPHHIYISTKNKHNLEEVFERLFNLNKR